MGSTGHLNKHPFYICRCGWELGPGGIDWEADGVANLYPAKLWILGIHSVTKQVLVENSLMELGKLARWLSGIYATTGPNRELALTGHPPLSYLCNIIVIIYIHKIKLRTHRP
jgi:hypothetical protein